MTATCKTYVTYVDTYLNWGTIRNYWEYYTDEEREYFLSQLDKLKEDDAK